MKQVLRFFLALLMFSLTVSIIEAQVMANANVQTANSTSSGTQLTISNFDVPAGNKSLIVVHITGSQSVTSVTYGGNALTEFLDVGSGGRRQFIYYRALGDLGSTETGNVVVNWSSSNAFRTIIATSFQNVDQTTPMNNSNSATDNAFPTLTITSSSGDMAVDNVSGEVSGTPTFTIDASQTLSACATSDTGGATERTICAGYESSTGASVAMDWTEGGTYNRPAHLGGNIQSGGALPVEFTDFKVHREDEHIKLYWQTASESNNKGFEVLRSNDFRNWESLGFVNGNGNTFVRQDYEFYDSKPFSGINYYRLKQTDFDGAFEYSNIVNIDLTNFEKSSKFKIHPNPTHNGTFILTLPENQAETVLWSMYDAAGKEVRRAENITGKYSVEVRDLKSGIYLVKAVIDGAVSWERVVVN